MKIGLMTWFRYNNYGTILQAYALQQVLKKNNYDSVLIDYKPRGTLKNINNINDLNKIIISKVKGTKYIVNETTFDDFIKEKLEISKQCNNYYELKELSKNLDAIVCGSDQIWSSSSFDANYFLPFAEQTKIMSYAPSFGKSAIDNAEISSKMKELIERFNIISVREKTGKKIIKDLCGKEATVTLDPTLLLNKEDWYKLVNNNLNNKLKTKNYILCYFLGDSNKYYNKILKLAKVNNLEIINIPALKNQKLNKYSKNIPVGPQDFITLIKNAKIILTDSFHGVIFSINFNRNFYAYKRFKDNDKKSQNSRVVDMLDTLGLSDRLTSNNTKFSCEAINYASINKKLNIIRKDSLKFLLSGLKNIGENKQCGENDNVTDLCCGCGACKAICQKNAIDISINNEGFYQYSKKQKNCINCHLCQKICPMNIVIADKITLNNKCYYFKSNDLQVLKNSSSGGAGYEIANYYNSIGYYICGATYDKFTKTVKHIIIKPNSNEELKKIQGSKYLQSYTYDAFKELLSLPADSKVVFFGTPCQVSAIDKLTNLKKIRKNYILVDIICHGVPSYHLWNKYIDELSLKYNDENCIDVKFRNKKYGWKDRRISLQGKKINYNGKDTKDLFYKFFRNGYVDNKCCYECPFRTASAADIKIGDYWSPSYSKDKEGVSMVIVINKTGEKIIKELSNTNTVIEQSINDFFKYQYVDNMNSNIYRENIIKDLKTKKELSDIYQHYFKYEELKNLLSNIYYHFRRK